MAASDPLTVIDGIVGAALTGFSGLMLVVPAGKIQVWDRDIDIRGEIERSADLGGRLWIIPDRSPTLLGWSSGSVRFERHYTIGFGVGRLKLEGIRAIEWQVVRALRRLFELKQADGVTPIAQPAPLVIEQIEIGGTDPEREPMADPEEWTDVCELTVVAFAPLTSL